MGLGFLGFFSGNIYGVAGSIFLMICHGFVSTGLFFIAGLLYERFYTRHIFEYGGLCTTMPLFTFFFFFFFFYFFFFFFFIIFFFFFFFFLFFFFFYFNNIIYLN